MAVSPFVVASPVTMMGVLTTIGPGVILVGAELLMRRGFVVAVLVVVVTLVAVVTVVAVWIVGLVLVVAVVVVKTFCTALTI